MSTPFNLPASALALILADVAVGTPAFSLGSRPSSYAGSKATTGSDSEEPDSEGEEGSFASSLDEKLEAKLSI